MLIGELSRASGVPARLLRYYEEQGLLRPGRDGKGYRTYDPGAVDLVSRIRELLAAGRSTDDIRGLMPCPLDPGRWVLSCEEALALVERRHAETEERIAELVAQRDRLGAQRDAIRDYLAGQVVQA
ncbi:MerR family transcriptional regulator [Nocardia puris]|nr:MerR family transcriptional regulator [Nocardia puris]MBF6215106.1 MerR family transcriptional regulator [Nocardia puris]MBF6369617.1 MerR family transcriptional regulator [Nocardia puris]